MKTHPKHRRMKMKRILAVLVVAAVLSIGAMALAHGGGYGGGYGGHMMGYGPGYDKDTSEYFDKTADLRKEFHDKRFEYMEAWRAGDREKAEKIAKELDEIAEKINAAAPKTTRGFGRGGYCW
jgi:hypothetical protein